MREAAQESRWFPIYENPALQPMLPPGLNLVLLIEQLIVYTDSHCLLLCGRFLDTLLLRAISIYLFSALSS